MMPWMNDLRCRSILHITSHSIHVSSTTAVSTAFWTGYPTKARRETGSVYHRHVSQDFKSSRQLVARYKPHSRPWPVLALRRAIQFCCKGRKIIIIQRSSQVYADALSQSDGILVELRDHPASRVDNGHLQPVGTLDIFEITRSKLSRRRTPRSLPDLVI
jgi:hypothetical protein